MSRLRPSRRTLLRSGLLLGLGGVRQWFSSGGEKYANKIRPVTGFHRCRWTWPTASQDRSPNGETTSRATNTPAADPSTAQPLNHRNRGKHMTDEEKQTTAQRAIGDFAPKLVELTDEVLFGDVWERAELSKRDRSLVTVAALVAGGNTEQLRNHLLRAKVNGLTENELKEAIIHLAFYAGWPRAMSAIQVAKAAFAE